MGVRRALMLAVLVGFAVFSPVIFLSSEVQSATKWVVVVDAGHGGHDPGARGFSGSVEKNINLEIAKLVRFLSLSDSRIEIVLTRYEDRFIELRERINIAERLNADAYVSIHANAHTTHQPSGMETLVHESRGVSNYSSSLNLARTLHNAVMDDIESHNVRDRGIKHRALYTRWASMPAILVETGFLTNPEEERKLHSVWYQLDLAQSILDGIKDYLRRY